MAGFLLCVFPTEEESTFWLIVVMLERLLGEYYSPTMEGIQIDMALMDRLVKAWGPFDLRERGGGSCLTVLCAHRSAFRIWRRTCSSWDSHSR